MPTRVRFVLNKLTGEVEEFVIDDQDRTLSEAEHDRIARDIGELIARNPTLSAAPRAAPWAAPKPLVDTETADREPTPLAPVPASDRHR